jgi:hypothetical protein
MSEKFKNMLYLAIRSMVALKKMKDDSRPSEIIPGLFIGSIGAALKKTVL